MDKQSDVKNADLTQATGGTQRRGLEFLHDVALTVSVELGAAEITIRQLIGLKVGSVLPLNRLQSDPLEIKVNGRPAARGEVVVVNDKMGVRVTDIIDPDQI